MTPILAFDIETVPDVAGIRAPARPARRPARRRRRRARVPEAPRADRQRFPAAVPAARDRDLLRDAQRRRRAGVLHRRARCRRGRGDPALLRRHRQARAADRVVERPRLRPAGAGEPRADPRRLGGVLLGQRQRQQGLPLQQLHQPLPRAPRRPDGRARALRRARLAARRPGAALRLPGQARHEAATRCGRASARARSRRSATTARRTAPTPTCSTCASS